MTVADRARRRTALAVAAVMLSAIAAATVILPSRLVSPPALVAASADPAYVRSLGIWLRTETDVTAMVEVPEEVRAQLADVGLAPRLGVPGALVVTHGDAGPGVPLARFGSGPAALTVTRPGTEADDRIARAARAGFGVQLAGNQAVTAPSEVRALLADGRVDPRALLLIAGMTTLGPVRVVALPAARHEDAGLPRHHLVLQGVDATHLDWLRAQRPPLAPSVVVDGDRATLAWPVPSPLGLIGG